MLQRTQEVIWPVEILPDEMEFGIAWRSECRTYALRMASLLTQPSLAGLTRGPPPALVCQNTQNSSSTVVNFMTMTTAPNSF
jgi:hypothetical protein